MKSLIEPTEDSLSTTSEYKKLQIKENNLFNHIDKLAADHDVIVTNTMIKITYKKALKDQNAADSNVDLPKEGKKTKPTNTENSFLGKSPKPVFHSTPKPPPIQTEKKKKYLNGLNLTTKPDNQEGKKNRTSHKVQKPSEGAGKNVPESDKRFLKGDGLMKPKASISEKGKAGKKKTKGGDKKIKKLENGVKKKNEVDKKGGKVGVVKRKASSTELNMLVKSKKMKISESEGKEVNGGGDAEEGNKSGGKRPIMLVDPELPVGWSRFIRIKDKDTANEQHVVYIVNPQGKKFRFKWKLRQYLQKTNSTLDADQFFFGLYQRPKASSSFEKLEDGSESSKEVENGLEKQDELSNDRKSSDGRELLLFDPDLPSGWKRVIHSNAVNGRKQVHIVSPEGKVFRRRYLLNEYLIKHQFNHSLDRFYFGLYPKKEGNSENSGKETEDKTLNSIKLMKPANSSKTPGSAMILKKAKITDSEIDLNHVKDGLIPPRAMFEDPNLPEGWKRFIKIRSCGESAGRMEVVIVSPDGRRHRSKKHLEHYLLQKQLKYKISDFDFTVFGKSNPKKRPPSPPNPPGPEPDPDPEPSDFSFLSMKKKFTDQPVPDLDISSLKDDLITPEGHMINTVNGLMMCSGLSSARNERRQRLPRTEHEKLLKSHLNSDCDLSCDVGCEIPRLWIERLVKCRAEFRSLESDAVSTIAKTTEEFIKRLSLHALANSQESEAGLRYEHLAEVVDQTECLSFLKELIPKKITFREYIKLNRPKQFLSFT